MIYEKETPLANGFHMPGELKSTKAALLFGLNVLAPGALALMRPVRPLLL